MPPTEAKQFCPGGEESGAVTGINRSLAGCRHQFRWRVCLQLGKTIGEVGGRQEAEGRQAENRHTIVIGVSRRVSSSFPSGGRLGEWHDT